MKLRNLTPDEIFILEKQGCRSADWMNVTIKEPFLSDRIWQTTFEGINTIGSFASENEHDENVPGIYYSRLINCEVGDQVRIDQVKCLENYKIGSGCTIEDVGKLSTVGESTFGNGTELEVLNEAGGRTLPIFDTLSAQIAWLLVKARHDKALVARIYDIIEAYVAEKKTTKGSIGAGSSIRNCSSIINVVVGESAELLGVQNLEEGTIGSEADAITKIGHGVIAKNFIIQEGSKVGEGAILDACFVGQAVKVGKQFSGENSVFFANSECFHGEGCSVFCGPYSVTHHKSSLLIAAEYSFYNAGSGTNQSNHMYKLGPMHQGIVERGSKTGSFSYMLWPSRVGPYSVVMGKHTTSFDAGEFPFSYISEEQGKSILTPAMNLFTVGTKRDIQKWPARDRRTGSAKFDKILFDLYSPFIIQKVKAAIEKLGELYQNTPKEQSTVFLNGLHINRLMLKTCRKYYELAQNVFFGKGLLYLLNQVEAAGSIVEVRQLAKDLDASGTGEWIDAAGLFLPITQLEQCIEEIKGRKVNSIEDLHDFFTEQLDAYGALKASYYKNILQEVKGIDLTEITEEQVIDLINNWKTASLKLNNMILKDAEKEFDATSHIGYGLSSGEGLQQADFREVHGSFDENGFVKGLKAEIELINQKAEEVINAFS